MGIVGYEGFAFGKSVNTDIQKASDGYSEQKCEHIDHNRHNGFQGFKTQSAQ